jgi:hypothetical protein
MSMEQLTPLLFGLVLLVVTLGMALSFLAGPMSLLRKTGVLRGIRWTLRSLGRAVAGGVRLLVRGRRARVRRPPSRAAFRHSR